MAGGDLFSPDGIDGTVRALLGAAAAPSLANARAAQLKQRPSEARTRLGRLYDSIEAGVEAVALVPRINAVQAEVDALEAEISLHPAPPDALSRALDAEPPRSGSDLRRWGKGRVRGGT